MKTFDFLENLVYSLVMHALLIDHEDSFTENIRSWLSATFTMTVTPFNDAAKIDSLMQSHNFDLIVLSPGPKSPYDYPTSLHLLSKIKNSQAVLGICLGMQMMFTSEGLAVVHAQSPMHGKISTLSFIDPQSADFNGIKVGRYHSLIVTAGYPFKNLAFATDDQSLQWAIHTTKKWMAIQFHPESFLTEKRENILGFISSWVKS